MDLARARDVRRSPFELLPEASLEARRPANGRWSTFGDETLGTVFELALALSISHYRGASPGQPGVGRVRHDGSNLFKPVPQDPPVWVHILFVDRLDGRGLGGLHVVVGPEAAPTPAAFEVAISRLSSPRCATW